jgi:ferritin-like metal-binding protein YciE
MSEMKNLKDLLKHELEDLYSAETQIIDALPAMVEQAGDRLLKKSLMDHLKVTKKQKARLDQVKKLLGQEKKEDMGIFARLFTGDGKQKCVAMEGLIDEGKKMMGEDMEPEVRDAAIIAAAQKIEHYEISGYGTAKAYALHLGLAKVASLINETLEEEYSSDNLLTDLAIGKVNLEAGGENGMKGLRRIPARRGKETRKPAGSAVSRPGRKKISKRSSANSSAKK